MCRADNITTFMCRLSWNLGASTSWNPLVLSRPVMGLLYVCVYWLVVASRKGSCWMGRAEIRREDILNRRGCKNLGKSENRVGFAGRWAVLRRGGRGRRHVHIEFHENLSLYDISRKIYFPQTQLCYCCFQIIEGKLTDINTLQVFLLPNTLENPQPKVWIRE